MGTHSLPIQIVDENDQPIGAASIGETQQKGLRHRVVRIMVEDENGRILLQKRTAGKHLYPSCWDNSAAGHVDEGESYEMAAARELQEEIGIAGFPLQEVDYYSTDRQHEGLRLRRFNRLYKLAVPAAVPLKLQPDEVAETQWFSRDEVCKLIEQYPDLVSDGLLEVYERHYLA